MEVTKQKRQGQAEQKREIDPSLIDELMKGYERPDDVVGSGGILEQLIKRLYERILGTEMSHHLGYQKGQAPKCAEGWYGRTTATEPAKRPC